jgi:Flp pilus assembly protein TadG
MNRDHSSERGNAILEFALVASLFLVPMLAGSYSIGMALVKMLQVNQVCRDTNILVVRGIDLSQSDNQSIVVKTASGLGMNVSGTNTPNTTGLGVIILSTVHRVNGADCAGQGYTSSGTNSDGTPNYPSCPNFLYYVFTQRIVIGNSAKLTSALGSPTDPLANNGTLTPAQYVVDSGDRATGFPSQTVLTAPANPYSAGGLVFLPQGGTAYISEAGFDISAINVFAINQMGVIYAINVS